MSRFEQGDYGAQFQQAKISMYIEREFLPPVPFSLMATACIIINLDSAQLGLGDVP